MDVNAQVEQVGGEAVPEGMSGVIHVVESGHFHTLGYGMSDGAFVHGPVGDIPFEEIFFSPLISVIGSQIVKDEFWKNGKAILVSLSLHDLDLHGFAVDA